MDGLSDKTIPVGGMGKLKISDCRNRVKTILLAMADGISRGDSKTEEYIAASFGGESEISLLIRALMKSRKSK